MTNDSRADRLECHTRRIASDLMAQACSTPPLLAAADDSSIALSTSCIVAQRL